MQTRHYITLYAKRIFFFENIFDKKNLISLTLNLLTTAIIATPSNSSKSQMGFNSAFKGLKYIQQSSLIQYQAHPAIDQTAYIDAWQKYHKTACTSLPEDKHLVVRNTSKSLIPNSVPNTHTHTHTHQYRPNKICSHTTKPTTTMYFN